MEALRQRGYYRELFQRFSFSDLGAEAEETSALFSSQGILPEQLDRFLNSPYQETGEIALMRAVLEDALKCFQRSALSNKRRAQRLAKEAEDWFFARGDGYVFSFVNICAVLGLNPEYIRLGLKRWRPIHMGTCLQP